MLLFITRLGIPVSTTFLVLTFFAPKALPQMLVKSLGGYGVAFTFAIVAFMVLSRVTERLFLRHPLDGDDHGLWTNRSFWTALQWGSTGFLWSQWLTQDLVNIMVYLGDPREVTPGTFAFALAVLLLMLGYIFYRRGGKIQEIVRVKTNTQDIRSATFIDFFYGLVLLLFKFDMPGIGAKIPMSTTWVFLGMLVDKGRVAHATRGNASRRQEGGFHGVFRPWEGDHRSRGKRLARGLLVLRGGP